MIRLAIAGGHGTIAMLLTEQLHLSPDPTEVRSLIRDPDQADDIRLVGGEPVTLDLEHAEVSEIADAIAGVDAVLFAAGAGPDSGPERKKTVDCGAAVKLVQACQQAGVDRYLMISSMGADDPPDGDDVFDVYLRAKADADRELMDSGLHWTIVRPGALTDDAATGKVEAGQHVPRSKIPRGDVAAVLAHLLTHPEQADGLLIEVVSGDTPLADALEAASG